MLDKDRSTAIFRICSGIADQRRAPCPCDQRRSPIFARTPPPYFPDRRQRHRLRSRVRKSRQVLSGLIGMQERALLLGGEFKTEGKPGAGTTVTLTLPLRPLSATGKTTP